MESFLAVGGIVALLLLITIGGKFLKGAGLKAALRAGDRLIDPDGTEGERALGDLQTSLRFSDPIAGRSVAGRALGKIIWVNADGDDAWSTGHRDSPTHISADWRVIEGVGVLAARRNVALGDGLPNSANWTSLMKRVTALAQKEGIAFEHGNVEFARVSTTPAVGNAVWERV